MNKLIIILGITLLTGCASKPYVEFGVSREYDGRPMDKTLAKWAVGTVWNNQAKYRKYDVDLRIEHESDPDRPEPYGSMDKLELNIRTYIFD